MRNVKNIFVIFALTIFIAISFGSKIIAANGMSISGPSIVIEGQDLIFTVRYDDNVSFIKLSDGDIVLNGFTASGKSVTGSGQIRTIKITNIRRTSSDYGNITINSGTGYLNSVTKLPATTSATFRIKTQTQIVEETTKPANNTNNVNSNTNNNKPSTTKPSNNTSNNQNNSNNTTNNVENSNNNNTQGNDNKSDVKDNNETDNKNDNTNASNNENTEKPEEPAINYDEVIPNPNTGKEF
ncbi:unknown [Clostridium sp. CAG:921]|nr:unknown [Clostridium sp. CAG:921]